MATTSEIDSFPTAELLNRYGISSKQALYDRLNALKIQPFKLKGNKGYVSAEQLALLDELDQHIKSGGAIADFEGISNISAISQLSPVDGTVLSGGQQTVSNEETLQPSQHQLISLLADGIAQAIAQQPPPQIDPLHSFRLLEEAANSGWALPSDTIRQLVGIRPSTAKGESSFSRGSFTFTKAGKIGTQIAWTVSRKIKSL